MKYEQYRPEEFFSDENFRKWILMNDPKLNFFWEGWILQHPEKKQELEIARKMVLALKFKDERITEDQKSSLWQRIIRENQSQESKNKIAKIRPLSDSHTSPRSRQPFSVYFYRVAAGLLLLLIAWAALQPLNKPEPAISDNNSVVKVNPAGQKSKIFLPDGSVVYLNASSKITYLENFEPFHRTIQLSGEAFFEVVKDSLRPFTVITSSVETTALGTKFNVSAFPQQSNIIVSLLDGKVEVKSETAGQRLILEERQAASFNLNSNQLNQSDFHFEQSILWKDGILYFNKTDLDAVLAQLERWYGVEFTVNGVPTDPQAISGRFENESLANVLQSIAFSSGFEYLIDGKNVNIKF